MNAFRLTASIAVAIALIYSNVELLGGDGHGSRWKMVYSHYRGWPVHFQKLSKAEQFVDDGSVYLNMTLTDVEWSIVEFSILALAVNVLVACVMLACVWRTTISLANRNGLQITISANLFATMFLAICIHQYLDGRDFIYVFESAPLYYGLGKENWLTLIPIAFGLTCALFAIFDLIIERFFRQTTRQHNLDGE